MVRIVAAAGALLILASCSKNSNDTVNNIKPITGTISISPPITADPAVYFQVAPSNGDPALLDVMFRSSGNPVSMAGYTLEIRFDQGVVQLGGELADGQMTGTPLGDCGNPDCMAVCGTYSCVTCNFCDTNGLTTIASGPSLVCLPNLDANRTGTLLLGVSATTIGCVTASVTTPVRLARLHLFPATTGSSQITLVRYPNNLPTGGCAILGPGAVDQGIPCFDGGAIFTATR